MGLLEKLFSENRRAEERHHALNADQRGRLRHIFVFDSGPVIGDEQKYCATIVRSLLPEVMAYADVPVSFQVDASMPRDLGFSRSRELEKAIQYPFAWRTITEANPILVDGLKVGKEHFTFSCEEYSRDNGNRGIVIAFYEFAG